MSSPLVFAVTAVIIIAVAVFYLFFYRDWRRQRELRRPFPEPWRKILETRVPLYTRLPTSLKLQLEQHVRLFVAEKNFYGCDGFAINDEVRITIAGHACLLTLARRWSDFDEVKSILVYPDVYRVEETEDDGIVVSVSHEVRAGEASDFGRVVLSWTECEAASRPGSLHNVILHEFAHQLDYLDGAADGAPPLSGTQARQWQQTMTDAYQHLRHSLSHHQHSWLDPYGATEPAEFFAVLTEAFFQQPRHLADEQPAVYAALCGFYRINLLELDTADATL